MGIQVEEANPPQPPQLNADGTPIPFEGPWPPLNVIQYPVYFAIAPGGIRFQKIDKLRTYLVEYTVVMNKLEPIGKFTFFTNSQTIDLPQLFAMCYSDFKSKFNTNLKVTDLV